MLVKVSNVKIKLVDNVTMLQIASCCTFYLFHNHQPNNLNWNVFNYNQSIWQNNTQIPESSKICYIYINLQPSCTKEHCVKSAQIRKYGPEKTPYLDTFQAVKPLKHLQ